MSTELGDLEQAAACFRKAIDAEPDNLRYHLSRCSLLEQVTLKKAMFHLCQKTKLCCILKSKCTVQVQGSNREMSAKFCNMDVQAKIPSVPICTKLIIKFGDYFVDFV